MTSEAIEKIKREMRQEWFYNNGLYEICESPEKAINEIVFRVLKEVESTLDSWGISKTSMSRAAIRSLKSESGLSGVAQEEKP